MAGIDDILQTISPGLGPAGSLISNAITAKKIMDAFNSKKKKQTPTATETEAVSPAPTRRISIEEPVGSSIEQTASGETEGSGGGSLKGASKGIGKGLGQFFSAMGLGAAQMPINMEGRGWESTLGGTIGAKVGSALINSVLFGPAAGRAAGVGAAPTMFNTVADRTQNVFGQMDAQTYQALQADLALIPEEVLSDSTKALPYYRDLLIKYPAAKSFLAEYFGFTRNYNYNFPQGVPPGKYNLGGASAVGVE